MDHFFNYAYAVELPTNALDPKSAITDMPTFFQQSFQLLIFAISAIAVLTITYWGVRYMLSNVAGIKGFGKERIWSALMGLVLALAAFLILETINPKINESLKHFVTGSNYYQINLTGDKK